MPWVSTDAPSHTRRASTAKKRRQWAHTANSVLESTGDEGRAVQAANAAVKRKRRRKRSY
jgi:hypothetical protein